ncbi:MAG: hypothetical protein HC880_16085 [Bacteroidia bacterium]|nr:hypothetical protein [Bacteroidia bacterium]
MTEKIEEWLLLDVVQDTQRAKDIKEVLQDPIVKEAFVDLDISGYSDEELRMVEYQGFEEEYGDIIEREKQKAAEEAEKQSKKETAQKLLTQGVALEIISQATGLSEEEIRAL